MAEEWMLLGLEDKVARRYGLPPRIPVPKEEYAGLAESGLPPEQVRKWITEFVAKHSSGLRTQEPELAARLDAYLGKGAHWKRAQDAFAKGDYAKAISALKLVVAVDANDHAARMNLASALAASGDTKKALEHLTAIRPTFEGDPDYHVTLGQVKLATGDRDGAVGEMVLALEAKPDHQGALDALKQLGVLLAVYENPRDAASLTYVRADSVVDWLKEVWDKEPRDAAYWLEQVAYHESERRFAVVLEAALRGQMAIEIDERGRERLATARIEALRALGRVDDALKGARGFIETAPQSSAGHVALARCLAATGDMDGAKAALDKALELDPGDLEALDLAFWPEQRELEPLLASLPKLQAFADAHANSAGALRSLARMKLAIGQADEALALFAKAVALAPDDDALRGEWWVELTRAQKLDQLVADAEKIPDLGKRDWKLRWSEAEAYAAQGKKEQAYAAFAAINADESLLVDVRKRAKRAAMQARGG